jgi:hypothetical protein
MLQNCSFERDKMVIATSLRAHEYSLQLDSARFRRVVKVFLTHHGFKSDDDLNIHWQFKDQQTAWNLVYSGFHIPDGVVEYLANLAERCPTRIENGKPCKSDCDKLSRWPILKATQLRFMIIRLER